MITDATIQSAKHGNIEYVLSRLGIRAVNAYGNFYRFRCPFHGSHGPDFVIAKDTGNCWCHSIACDAHKPMDLIKFVEKLAGLSFKDSIEFITGSKIDVPAVEIKTSNRTDPEKQAYMLKRFKESQSSLGRNRSRIYWGRRGISAETVDQLKLGAVQMRPNPITDSREHIRHLIPLFTAGRLVSIQARRDDYDCLKRVELFDKEWLHMNAGSSDPKVYLETLFGPKFIVYGGAAGASRNRIFNNDSIAQVVAGKIVPRSLPLAFAQESIGDAIAVHDCGYPSVSARYADTIGQALAGAEQVIILQQNDGEAGKLYAEDMLERMKHPGARIVVIPDPYKDSLEMAEAGVLRDWLKGIV